MRRMITKNQLDNEIKVVEKDISTLIDKDGHKRFVNGNGVPAEITGFTASYCKWSVSDSHLMIVLAGTFADESELQNSGLAEYDLPSWIKDKISPVWSVYIEAKSVKVYNSDWSTQDMGVVLEKTSNGVKITQTGGTFTLTKERSFRVTFDLNID